MGMKADQRSDIYALGTVIYEALSGVCPFMAADPLTTLRMRLNSRPMPLSEFTFGESIPQQVQVAVMKALEREPEARFQGMGQMLQALQDA
jgi:serine/threonine-protein kinase